jgi:peptidylprolyl isomerase
MKYAFLTTIALTFIISACSPSAQNSGDLNYGPPIAIDTTYANGLTLRDIELGEGAPVDSGDYFRAHYSGYLSNGDIFDSTLENNTPIGFQLGVGQLLPAWELGLVGMRKGGKRVIVSPPELGFGTTGIPGIIPANETLRFEIELLDVRKTPTPWVYNESRSRVSESGIRYLTVRNGSGDKPLPGDLALVHYSGFLESGPLFDSSYLRDEPFQLRVGIGQVIAGWEETIQDMRPGEQRIVFIPSELAYGESGAGDGIIPPNSTLRFDIELAEVIRQ